MLPLCASVRSQAALQAWWNMKMFSVTEGRAEEYILSPNSNLASDPTSLAFALEFAEQEQYITIIH